MVYDAKDPRSSLASASSADLNSATEFAGMEY